MKLMFYKFWILVLLMGTSSQVGASPYEITYQGRITDQSGTPLSAPVNLEIRFFDAETAGSELISVEFYPNIALDSNGVFSLPLGLSDAQYESLLTGTGDVWLEVKDVTNNTIFPRQKLTAVPFARKVPVDGSTIGYSNSGELQVEGLSGSSLPVGTPAEGQILKWQSGQWSFANDLTAGAGAVTTSDISDGTLLDIDVSATAAISGAKINPNFGSQNIVTTGTISADGSLLTNLPAGPLGSAIESSEITDGTIVNDDIAATAAISTSKISGLGSLSTLSAVGSAEITDGEILDDDIAATAAISGSKISPNFGSQNIVTTGTISGDGSLLTNLPAGSLGTTIESAEITDGTIVDGDIAATAAISTSKISGLGSLSTLSAVGSAEITDGEILDDDIAATAAISGSKISPNFGSQNIVTTGTITGDGSGLTNIPAGPLGSTIETSEITDGTIVNDDIAATAAISTAKISGLGSLAVLNAVGSSQITDGEILNDDIAATAAISGSKISPNFGSQNIVTTGTITGDGSGLTNIPAGPLGSTIETSEITDGTILNDDIAATAAISTSKISGLGSLASLNALGSSQITDGEILDADIAATAAISGGKINPNFGSQNITTTGTISGDGSGLTNVPAGPLGTTIDSSEIVDGTITDSDIAATAAISSCPCLTLTS